MLCLAVLLTSPVIRKYIINYGRPFIFSTSLPTLNVCALETTFDYIESAAGDKVQHASILAIDQPLAESSY